VIRPRSTLVARPPCSRGPAPSPPLAIEARRCNRCGRCLSLGCAAIADLGGEALEIDAAVCSGGGACAPLCRSRAITPSS
jgi:indolepyruvate ferredoxin oxidoreductase alpha subunit